MARKIMLPVPKTLLGLVVVILLAMFAVVPFVELLHEILFKSYSITCEVKPSFWFYFLGIISSIYLLYIAIGWKKIWGNIF